MSGVLAVVATADRPFPADAWCEAVRLAGRFGESVVTRSGVAGGIAGWRRSSGEFAGSGSLRPREGDGGVDASGPPGPRGPRGPASTWLGYDRQDRLPAVVVPGSPADDETLRSLDGEWVALWVDPDAGRLTVSTDRWRHRQVFVHEGRDIVAVSTDWRLLLPFLPTPRIAADALALFLSIGELIDDLTLLEGVETLTPGTRLDAGPGHGVTRRTWYRHRIHGDQRDRTALRRGWADALDRSIRETGELAARFTAPLSGGLDSRLIVARCGLGDRVTATTWGEPECRDIRFARRVAAACGVEHRAYSVDPTRHPDHWSAAVDLTGGMFGLCDMHIAPFVERVAEHGEVMLNGLAGDVVLGGNFIKRPWLEQSDPAALAADTWAWRLGPATESMVTDLLPEGSHLAARGRWIDSIITRCDGGSPAARLHEWLVANRVFRWTNSGTDIVRRQADSISPFFANGVIEMLEATPMEAKRRHRLYLDVLREIGGPAARVPWDRTAIPPALGWHAAVGSMAMHRIAKRLLGGMPGPQTARIPHWMHGPWRPAMADLLGSSHLEVVGLLTPGVASELLSRHHPERDISQFLGRLGAAELLQRHVDATVG